MRSFIVVPLMAIIFIVFDGASANCYDDFVANNPTATELVTCCGGAGLTLPHSLTTLASLTEIRLHDCNFSSTLPEGLGDLSNLHWLAIANNKNLSGPLPDLNKFTQMSILSLQGNQFSGSVPSVLGTIQTLTKLDLANNRLTGTIPAELANLSSLNILHLNNNRFHGGLPALPIDVDSPPASGTEGYYQYLASGDDCSMGNEDQCSLAADACNIYGACCSPGEKCPKVLDQRSCNIDTLACPGDGLDQFDCDDAQVCVQGFCGDGPYGRKGMCCGSKSIDVGCVAEYAKLRIESNNWCLVCEAYNEFGLQNCKEPTDIPGEGKLPSDATHIVCENDNSRLGISLGSINFTKDIDLKYLSLHGKEVRIYDMGTLNSKFPSLTHLDLSGIAQRIGGFNSQIISTDENWSELKHLNLSGTEFGCVREGTKCFSGGVKLPKLRVLDISHMGLKIRDNIKGVAVLTTLEELYINDNVLETIPDNFFALLVKLTKLRIRGNFIPETLPDYIFRRALPLDSDVPWKSVIGPRAPPSFEGKDRPRRPDNRAESWIAPVVAGSVVGILAVVAAVLIVMKENRAVRTEMVSRHSEHIFERRSGRRENMEETMNNKDRAMSL